MNRWGGAVQLPRVLELLTGG
ncbi:hypothetical protein DSM3645_10687 [Blastopirellula marina DSM 3645]|uniref:Uncharacterized protein n=1 Tax=Blastopirellula marina DSM 3645 TaxID=314230 RepID=A3ZSN3_9BACT|nr:hypothetical protein DSM3645_10687 [Blastopirellula marina DSM 3645]